MRELRIVRGGQSTSDTHEPTDEQLIDAIQQGDDRASERIYDKLARTVDATLYRVLGRRGSDHDDLVQSTFEQVVVTIARRRYARACSLKSWAATIATHVALNALRSRRRERRLLDIAGEALADVESRDIERDLGSRRELAQLRGHLAAMDPVKAMAVLLHDGFGYQLAEVAQLTDCTVAAAQTRLVRGRRDLLARVMRDAKGRPRNDSEEGGA
jgi:RNA polymerase sigma-70 factor, ECF subfamily